MRWLIPILLWSGCKKHHDGPSVTLELDRGSPSCRADVTDEVALDRALELLRMRVGDAGDVDIRNGKLVIEVGEDDRLVLFELRDLALRNATLEMKVVDNASPYMAELFRHVGSDPKSGDPSDPEAIAAGIRADVDTWDAERGRQVDYYLRASDPKKITAYVAALAARDPKYAMPADRELVFEHVEPPADAKDHAVYWRSYYVERTAAITGASIAKASGSYDPNSEYPIVLLDFTREGTQQLDAVTSRIVGHKLATIFDGKVKSAPVITGPIRGGRASITMGGNDQHERERDRDDLVAALKVGAMPCPLREAKP